MSNNQARDTTSELSGTVMGLGMLAASNPIGAIVLAGIVSVMAVVVVVSIDVWNAREAWMPYAIVLGLFGLLWFCHRFVWGLALGPRWGRKVTLGVFLSVMAYVEFSAGLVGVMIGNVTGVNPEQFLMDRVGVPMPQGVREGIQIQQAGWRRDNQCIADKASGALFAGTSPAVYQAQACSKHLTAVEQRRACRLLDERADQMVDYLNEDFCRRIGLYTTARKGKVGP